MAIYWDKKNKSCYPLIIKEIDEIVKICLSKNGYFEVSDYLNKETDIAESNHAIAKRKKLQIDYHTEEMMFTLKGMCYFTNGFGRPSTVSNSDFQKFKPVFEMLVSKGDLKPEILKYFE